MARTFDPIVAAIGSISARDEALQLMDTIVNTVHRGDIDSMKRTLGDRTCGFLRGMRDKLLTDDGFNPSDKQMNWLRILAGGGGTAYRREGRR